MVNPTSQQSQLAKLKAKFVQLAEQHKTVVSELKKKLEYEQAKSSSSSDDLIKKVAELENALRQETSKSESFAKKLKESNDGTLDVDAIKNAVIAAAQIETLKQELDEANQRFTKLKNETKDKISQLQEGLREEMTKSTKTTAEARAKITQLEEERVRYASSHELLEKYEKTIKENVESITKQQDEIAILKAEVEKLKQNAVDYSNQVAEEKRLMAEEIEKIKKEYFVLKEDADNLFSITRTFDIIKIEDEVAALKRKNAEVTKIGNQEKLKASLIEVVETTKKAKEFEKHAKTKISNFLNELFEMESRLKNKIAIK